MRHSLPRPVDVRYSESSVDRVTYDQTSNLGVPYPQTNQHIILDLPHGTHIYMGVSNRKFILGEHFSGANYENLGVS